MSEVRYMSKHNICQSEILCQNAIYIKPITRVRTQYVLYVTYVNYRIYVALATMLYKYSISNALYYVSAVRR